MADPTSLESAGRLVAPVSLAGEQLLPVLPALAGLFPGGGLRRGGVVGVGGTGSMSLALALTAAATAGGSWAAVVGLPALGLVAAAELGVALERLAVVAAPGGQWATVTAALLDALDLVVVRPAGRARPVEARRLAARARERRAVLLTFTESWPEPLDVRLGVAAAAWQGLGDGHGHLRRRRVEVRVEGRGAASRPRRVALWLPGEEGVQVAGADAGTAGAVAAGERRGLAVG